MFHRLKIDYRNLAVVTHMSPQPEPGLHVLVPRLDDDCELVYWYPEGARVPLDRLVGEVEATLDGELQLHYDRRLLADQLGYLQTCIDRVRGPGFIPVDVRLDGIHLQITPEGFSLEYGPRKVGAAFTVPPFFVERLQAELLRLTVRIEAIKQVTHEDDLEAELEHFFNRIELYWET